MIYVSQRGKGIQMNYSRLQKSNRTKLIKNKMKFVKELTADRYEEININECKCPGCNRKMEITSHRYKPFLIEATCIKCDYKGKITTHRKKDGTAFYAWYATPADKETRHLRDEAHHYFDQIIKAHIFPNKETAYKWLAEKLLMAETNCHLYHIGYMNSAFAKQTIKLSLEVLFNNKERLPKPVSIYTKPWSYSKKEGLI